MNITPLSTTDLLSLSPFLILLGGGLILLLITAFFSAASKKYALYITLTTILGAVFALYNAPISKNPLLTPWLKFDSLSYLLSMLFLFIGIASTLLSSPFFKTFGSSRGEYYFLLLSTLFGLLLIADAQDFLTLFLGIETLSISLYVMCGYIKHWKFSNESAIKYFFMGSLAAAFLLYGIALIYGATGTTRLDLLLPAFKTLTNNADKVLFFSGIGFVTLALAFEAAVVPFHMWAPDVYDGAPNPVTAFMAVGTKAGAFAAFIRVFFTSLPQFNSLWNEGVAILAAITLIYANFVALRQNRMRRFFAYSGISHAGFLLIPVVAGTPAALQALLFYLVVYTVATLGCFAVLAYLDKSSDGVVFDDLHGLFKRAPFLAFLFTLCLLTLAGIPPTIGFFAKFYIFKAAFETGYYGLVLVGLLTTILSAFYYLRIVGIMLSDTGEKPFSLVYSRSALLVSAVTLILLVGFSLFPNPVINFLASTLTGQPI